ncbi:MAG: hypothetical protein SH859_09120 [Hyphomicrobium aestuarii]|nr:hypothetical protein [Hyphomicrobium aestuarii]
MKSARRPATCILHAYGLSQSPHNMPLRVSGMVLTLTMIGLSAGLCLWLSAPLALRFENKAAEP